MILRSSTPLHTGFAVRARASRRAKQCFRSVPAEDRRYYFRNRYYSAGLGRFVSRDPIRFDAGDHNVFRLELNTPLMLTDANGLSATDNTSVAACQDATPNEMMASFLTGLGPSSYSFGPNSCHTKRFASQQQVGGVRTEVTDALSMHCILSCKSEYSTTRYYSYQDEASQLWRFIKDVPRFATFTADILVMTGGFRIKASGTGNCKAGKGEISFNVHNQMSLHSMTRIPGTKIGLPSPTWGGPLGTIRQDFNWTEDVDILKNEDCCGR